LDTTPPPPPAPDPRPTTHRRAAICPAPAALKCLAVHILFVGRPVAGPSSGWPAACPPDHGRV